MQRLRGVNMLGGFEEQQGGQCGCSRRSKRKRDEKNQHSDEVGQDYVRLVNRGRDLDFTLRETG